MKKLAYLFVAVCLLGSCSQGNKAESEESADSTPVEAVEETSSEEPKIDSEATTVSTESEAPKETAAAPTTQPAPAPQATKATSSADVKNDLKKFNDYVSKAAMAAKKLKKGDVNAIAECTKLMNEAQQMAANLSVNASELDPNQLKQYRDLQNKLKNAQNLINKVGTADKIKDAAKTIDEAAKGVGENVSEKTEEIVNKAATKINNKLNLGGGDKK